MIGIYTAGIVAILAIFVIIYRNNARQKARIDVLQTRLLEQIRERFEKVEAKLRELEDAKKQNTQID